MFTKKRSSFKIQIFFPPYNCDALYKKVSVRWKNAKSKNFADLIENYISWLNVKGFTKDKVINYYDYKGAIWTVSPIW